MGETADVRSVDAIREFRVALATFSEEALGALGAVDMEIRRTVQWVQYDRRGYWQEQIKRRREAVAVARAEVFRRQLQKTDDHTPAMSEQKENLRKAEASLREAEAKAALVKKWEPALQQAVLECRAATRRISNLASGDVPRAIAVLGRIVEALEAYLAEAPPGLGASAPPLASIAGSAMAADDATAPESPDDEPTGAEAGPVEAPESKSE